MTLRNILHGLPWLGDPLPDLRASDASSDAAGIVRAFRRLTGWILSGRGLRSVLPEMFAIAGLLGMIWVSTVEILARERAHELETAGGMAVALSEAFAETTARIVSEVDQTLLSARTSLAQLGKDFDIQRWAHDQIRNDQLRVQVALMDKDGYVIKSTLERSNQGRINIADRPHFRYQLDPSRDELYISDPVIGRGSKERTIQFSRKVLDQNGEFNGVVVLSLGCAEVSRFYNTAGTDEGAVTIANERGVIIAGGNGPEEVVGSNMVIPVNFDPTKNNGASLTVTKHGDLVAYKRLKRYPITTMIRRNANQIYGRYWVTVRHFVVASSLASLIVVLLGVFWLSQRRRAVESSQALAVTLSSVVQGIAMIDFRGRISVLNDRARALLRISRQGTGTAQEMIDRLVSAGSPCLVSAQPGAADADRRSLVSIADDGQVIEISTTRLPDGGKVHTLTDITEQHRAQTRIHYLAHHDALTGLPNRVLLAERIRAALSNAEATDHAVAVMFLDLDGFKGVNDTRGHLFGDRLLQHVAGLIQATIGAGDFVARLGGDEFTIVRAGTTDLAEAVRLAPLLIERISDPVTIEGREVRVSASIGIAMYPRDGTDHHELFKHADIALYRAKSEGRATYRLFERGMDESLRRRMMLEELLRNALDANQLQVHFQPQMEIGSLRIVGFEALARWEHPRLGFVPPADFIALAEECGLINRLGAFVLRQACHEATSWPASCYVSVNVSPLQLLDTRFPELVQNVLAEAGLPPRRLELEITESAMTDDSGHTMATLESLRALGVRLALDDFGTGYSSLSNLLRIRFEKVKIDSSFVQGQLHDPKAHAIVGAILAMSQHMGLTVTAEGVETEAHLAMLRGQKCPLIQGYWSGRAIAGGETLTLLRESQSRSRVARQIAEIVAGHASEPAPLAPLG
jgi:diguanylate cyclase (GGDEF)-like protein